MPRALARGEDSKNKSLHPRPTERPRRGRAGTGAQNIFQESLILRFF
ncbi:MAG: hypothetical protein O9346_17525 [Leptospiraceae bacterium]|nr:hypothetical protein [Leptospiraceae bacterium]